MEYLFILGRNPELSAAEIKSFLERERINFRIISKISNGILIETDRKLEWKTIDILGGVISIGEVMAEGDSKEIIKKLEKQELYTGNNNKLNYTLADFNSRDFEDIRDYLKKRFKKEGLKATEKKLTGRIKLQTGKYVSKVSSNLINEQYFIFENKFGRIIETANPEETEKRDMGKPVRRSELSISPRLAKILINLSQIRKNEVLLDPFCGIGSILQEALLQNIEVIGVDKDKDAINNAKLNMNWFHFNKDNYKLINGDSSKIQIKADAIATEPQLGELHKKIPSPEKAKQAITDFENLMITILNNLKKGVNGRIVFTAPLIQTEKKRLSCDFKRISMKTGLKIADGFPINEFREDSIVGRSIVVAKK